MFLNIFLNFINFLSTLSTSYQLFINFINSYQLFIINLVQTLKNDRVHKKKRCPTLNVLSVY